jgi:MFS superfamily sulfate permease-like transporter
MGNAKNKSWIYDLIAAISVSLVALPISLALAKASGVNPIAGVISTVVGGIVMFFLGGSHVTITGPGNGLVLVIAASVGSIGYASTLTAIIVAGLLLIVFGFIKLGNLSDFFPASSIQGLLVAIGLTLILKQFHLMLGMDKPFSSDTSTFSIIGYVPEMVRGFIQAPSADGILGVIGFLILFFYGFIKHKIVKFMPAPMWVVLIGVGFYYYYEFTGQEFPIPSEKLLFIDTSELSKF